MNNTQLSKPDPKGKAIASFVLGFISVVLGFFASIPQSLNPLIGPEWLDGRTAPPLLKILILFLFFSPPLIVITGLIGVIFGIIGLKSTKKTFAIIGLLLGAISFLCGLLLLFFLLFSAGL